MVFCIIECDGRRMLIGRDLGIIMYNVRKGLTYMSVDNYRLATK